MTRKENERLARLEQSVKDLTKCVDNHIIHSLYKLEARQWKIAVGILGANLLAGLSALLQVLF